MIQAGFAPRAELTPARAKAIICFGAAVIVALSMNMANLAMVWHLRAYRDASNSQIGFFAAMFWLGYGTACHLVQPRFAHRSAARVLQVATTGMAVCVYLFAVVPWLPLLHVLAAVKGICVSLFWPVVMGWVTAGQEGVELNRTMSRFNLSWSAGMIVGPFLAGWLADVDTMLPVLVAAYCFASASLLILTVSEWRPSVRRDRSGGAPTSLDAPAVDRSTPLRFPAWVGHFVAFMALGVILNVFPIVAVEELGMSRSMAGSLLFQRSLVSTLLFVVLGRLTLWHFRRWPMLASTLALGVLYAALIVATSIPVLLMVFGAMGLFTAVTYNCSLFHGAAGSVNRTARMAMHESLIGAGLVVGSYAGGWLNEYYGYRVVYSFAAGSFAVAAVIQLVLFRRQATLAG